MKTTGNDDHMETRISNLENGFRDLSGAVGIISGKVDKIADAVSALGTQVAANKPLSFQTILTTAITTATLVSMIVGAVFFLVDTRVGSATTRANAFVDSMTTDGKIYVQIDRFNNRLNRIESAIAWKPTVTATNGGD